MHTSCNYVGVINVEYWTQMSSVCVPTELKQWNTLNYVEIWWVIQMQLLNEFKSTCEIVHL